MRPKTILDHLKAGKRVTYTILRERGYLTGEASLVFTPDTLKLSGEQFIADRLRNFRFDEKPYSKPRWSVG